MAELSYFVDVTTLAGTLERYELPYALDDHDAVLLAGLVSLDSSTVVVRQGRRFVASFTHATRIASAESRPIDIFSAD